MKSSKLLLAIVAAITLLHVAAAHAAGVDMTEARRAVAREDDVRIDAQLLQDTVSNGSPIGVTYQIQNLSASSVAIADKVTDVSYDPETRTITIAFGCEVPTDGILPKLTIITAGQTKAFNGGGMARFANPVRGPFATPPAFVQIKVNILRDPAPFAAAGPRMSDELFDRWLESNDAIFLNSLPVRYSPRGTMPAVDASQRMASMR